MAEPSGSGMVTFTKADTLVDDLLGNGEANPGDTIQYDMTINNTTMSDLTNIVLTDVLDANVTWDSTFKSTPLAFTDAVTVTEDMATSITLTGSDIDGDTLTFSILTPPTNGALGGITPQTATTASVTYTPNMGVTGADSFTFQVMDDDGNIDSDTVNITIESAVNTPPALDLDANDSSGAGGNDYNTSFVEDAGAVPIADADVLITDDGANLVTAVITLTNPLDMGAESLTVNGALPGGLGGMIAPSGHVITLTGSTTLANYQTAIRQIEYNNSSDMLTITDRTVNVVVNDGTNNSNIAVATLTLSAANDAPEIDLDSDDSTGASGSDVNVTFTEDAGAVQLSSGIVITDVDDIELESAAITLTNPQNGISETLSINSGLATGFGITVLFGANNHSIALSGSATEDEYRQVLETVMYDNAHDDPNTAARTVTYVINDGDDDSNTATATITIVPVNDPPGATDDNYNVIGNTLFAVGVVMPPTPVLTATGSVLDNDADPEMGGLSVSAFDAASVQGGTITMQVDGTFTYLPPVGYEGADSFTYTITDGNDTGTATVNLTVADLVWYIDNTAAGGGDGRSNAPFDSLTAYGSASDESDDYIFIYTGSGDSTNLDTGITLLDGQRLIGQGVDLIVGAHTLVTAATNPVITNSNVNGNGVTLASNNTIRGLTIDSTNRAGITGSSVGTLTISDTAVTNAGNAAVILANGSASVAFTTLGSTGSAGRGINIDTVSGSFTVSGNTTITNSNNNGIRVVNSAGLTADFGTTTINDAGTAGIDLSNNGGSSFVFDALDITMSGGGTGLLANNSGTVTVTGAGNVINITGGAGTGVNMTSSSIGAGGMTFQSISAAGADTGITLNNTGSGAFTVTGVGTTDGSGGTLQNMNDHGIELISAQNVTISNMDLTNAATTAEVAAGTGNCDDESSASGTNVACNAPVQIVDATNISLTNLTINGSEQHGINGNNVTGFSLSNTDIINIGDDSLENGMHIINLLGTVTFNNVSVFGSMTRNVLIENNTGTAVITVTNSTINNSGEEDGFHLVGRDNANVTLNVSDSTFIHNDAPQLKAHAEDSSTVNVTITDNTFDGEPTVVGNTGVDLAVRDNANLTFDVSGTTLGDQVFEEMRGQVINVIAIGGGTASGHINRNDINGSNQGAGIRVVSEVTINGNAPSVTVEIDGNDIVGVAGGGSLAGIHIESRDGTSGFTGPANVQATINNNDVRIAGAASAIQAFINGGNTLCLDVTNNNVFDVHTSGFPGHGSTHFIANPLGGGGAGNITYEGYLAGNLGGTWTANGNTSSETVVAGNTGEVELLGTEPTNGTCATVSLLSTGTMVVDAGLVEEVAETAVTKPTSITKLAAPDATFNLGAGTIPAGKSMTITIDVVINASFPDSATQISNQATITADGALTLLSDDPDTPAPNDPTVTPVIKLEVIFLPMVMNNFASLADIVINSLVVSSSNVTIEIENIGDAAVTENFWVDLYIDPNPAPTAVNQTWELLANEGMVWGVTQSLAVGETLTLTINDAYYDASKSNFSGSVLSGAQVYVQVDSANTLTTYGAIEESHEYYGTAYNNIISVSAP